MISLSEIQPGRKFVYSTPDASDPIITVHLRGVFLEPVKRVEDCYHNAGCRTHEAEVQYDFRPEGNTSIIGIVPDQVETRKGERIAISFKHIESHPRFPPEKGPFPSDRYTTHSRFQELTGETFPDVPNSRFFCSALSLENPA
jgi:hypothetical protein